MHGMSLCGLFNVPHVQYLLELLLFPQLEVDLSLAGVDQTLSYAFVSFLSGLSGVTALC